MELSVFTKLVSESKNICVVGHKSPDADCVGSMLTMQYLLEEAYDKSVKLVCVDEFDETLDLIFGKGIDCDKKISDECDLVVFVDCSSISVSGLGKSSLQGKTIISVDHHASHTGFGDLNLVLDVSSTCEIIFKLYEQFDLELTNGISVFLMAGILFDTGGLSHDNTSAETLRVVGELVRNGVDIQRLNYLLFKKNSVRNLRMFGVIFKRMKVNKNGVLSCIISSEELKEMNCSETEVKKVIDYLNQVEEKNIALLGVETSENNMKFSVRSNNDYFDVSKIAQLFEGGGHKKAAGFRVEI